MKRFLAAAVAFLCFFGSVSTAQVTPCPGCKSITRNTPCVHYGVILFGTKLRVRLQGADGLCVIYEGDCLPLKNCVAKMRVEYQSGTNVDIFIYVDGNLVSLGNYPPANTWTPVLDSSGNMGCGDPPTDVSAIVLEPSGGYAVCDGKFKCTKCID